MEKIFKEDFDFEITEILLAHKDNFSANCSFSGYRKGRKTSGIVYCISGSAVFFFEDDRLILNSERLLFIPKNCAYTVKNQGDKAFSHITVNFKIEDPTLYNEVREVIADTFGADELLEKLVSVWTEKKQGYRPLAKSLLYEFMYKYYKNLSKNHRSKDYEKILPAKRILDEKYKENIHISVLADSCGFSETHFRRIFFKIFQCSPTEYRLNKRIILAKELLKNGELTVSEVGSYVGFNDSSYFCRVFKTQTNYTPLEYAAKERI